MIKFRIYVVGNALAYQTSFVCLIVATNEADVYKMAKYLCPGLSLEIKKVYDLDNLLYNNL